MSNPMYPAEPSGSPRPSESAPRSLSVSRILLALALPFALAAGFLLAVPISETSNPSMILWLAGVGCAGVAWLCAFLGTICGVVGLRKQSRYSIQALVVVALNVLICMLPFLCWLLLLVGVW